MSRQAFIKKVTQRIIKNYNPLKIILFGSQASGKVRPDSDIDIFVLAESNEKPVQRRIKLSKMFLDRVYPLDFIVYTPVELKKRLNDSFVKEIISNGKVLYEK